MTTTQNLDKTTVNGTVKAQKRFIETWYGKVILALGLPIVLITLIWVLSEDSENFFFPPLSKIVSVFPETWLEGRLVGDVLPSLYRLLFGYFGALIFGILLGVLIGLSKTVRYLVEPVLEFFRAIPPPVLIPILMVLLGIGDDMKIFVIALGCIWPILLNTVEGVRAVDEVLGDTAKVYKFKPMTKFTKLILPAASPQIMTGGRQALSLGIILMVVSEMFAAENGIGYAFVRFQRDVDIPKMWTGIIVLGLLGVIMSIIYRFVERRILRWYYGARLMQTKGN